jgi:serine/threonine protein kinase
MEQADGRHFLIMELVEGETLAERLQRGPLPVEDGLRIAQQIAEGLDAAHGSWFQELRAKVPTGR